MKKPDDFEKNIKQQLDDSVEALPEAVRTKLAAARQTALLAAQAAATPKGNVVGINNASATKPQQWSKPMWAVAASLCVMVPLWYVSQNLPVDSSDVGFAAIDSPLYTQSTTLSALDIMSTLAELDDEEMELLDNLEFALWLSEQEQASAHG